MLLISVMDKNNSFENEVMLDQNAIVFTEKHLAYFTDDIKPLLDSVNNEWVKVNNNLVVDIFKNTSFDFYIKRKDS